LLFHDKNGCANGHQCYGIYTLPVLCFVTSVQHRIPEIMVTQEEDDYKKTTHYFLSDNGYYKILTPHRRVLGKKK